MNDSDNDGAMSSGAVYVWRRAAMAWGFDAYIKASNTGAQDWFGYALAISSDGTVLAVGAQTEDGSSIGVGSASNEGSSDSGAAYLYRRVAGTWGNGLYIKATNTGAGDLFGGFVALSANGSVLLVGAAGEDGARTYVDPISDELAMDSGAAYLYRF